MIVNENLDIDFSLIIPTRERIPFLERCLLSFFEKAKRKHNNEAIVIVDHDDASIRNFGDFILKHQLNVRVIQVWRSEMMIRDYNNYGAQCSLGKYIWMLNDDYEMTTDNWDEIAKEKMESFCATNNDRCCYMMMDDSTHTNWGTARTNGCCCPVITRECVEVMNAVMPWQIYSWGADISLFNIFKRLSKNRILDLTSEIKVLHHCRHNNTATIDHISHRIEQISQKRMHIDEPDMVNYVSKLEGIVNKG
jgi:hypothetical protein